MGQPVKCSCGYYTWVEAPYVFEENGVIHTVNACGKHLGGWNTTHEQTVAANRDGVGFKADTGKPDYALLPWEPLEDVVQVLTLGAQKYAADNWQKVPNAERRYIAAAFRHLVARAKGEKLDPETGKPHLAHAMCCLLFLAWFDRRGA